MRTLTRRLFLRNVPPVLAGGTPVVSIAKGVEIGTMLRPSQIAAELLGRRRIAVLSGPSHAEEVARGIPTAVVAASRSAKLAPSG